MVIKQNIMKINLGSGYVSNRGLCAAAEAYNRFIEEHPNAKRYYGDLRSAKVKYKAVYKLYYWRYPSNNAYCPKYKSLHSTWVEE